MVKINSIDIDDTPLRFGKYKGQTPNEIAENDPGYILWLWEELPTAKTLVSKDLVQSCELDQVHGPDEGDRWSIY